MGLKICYKLEFNGDYEQLLCFFDSFSIDVRELSTIKEDGTLLFAKPHQYRIFNKFPKKIPRNSDKDFLNILILKNYNRRKKPYYRTSLGILQEIELGKGCENFEIGLGNINEERTIWQSNIICCVKTQYAQDFLASHLLAIKILDLLKSYGLKFLFIKDQGNYYETRNLSILKKELINWDNAVQLVTESITKDTKIDYISSLENCMKKNIS